jgi:hypothetical protein
MPMWIGGWRGGPDFVKAKKLVTIMKLVTHAGCNPVEER